MRIAEILQEGTAKFNNALRAAAATGQSHLWQQAFNALEYEQWLRQVRGEPAPSVQYSAPFARAIADNKAKILAAIDAMGPIPKLKAIESLLDADVDWPELQRKKSATTNNRAAMLAPLIKAIKQGDWRSFTDAVEAIRDAGMPGDVSQLLLRARGDIEAGFKKQVQHGWVERAKQEYDDLIKMGAQLTPFLDIVNSQKPSILRYILGVIKYDEQRRDWMPQKMVAGLRNVGIDWPELAAIDKSQGRKMTNNELMRSVGDVLSLYGRD